MTGALAGRCALVTGMHRSGTSLVAQLLARAGLHLGDGLLGPASHNPDGLFEDPDIVAFHDAVLGDNGLTWSSVRTADAVRVSAARRDAARALLRAKFDGRPAWGFKDPRAALVLDAWRELVPGAKWVLVIRDPAQVAWSLVRRSVHRRLDRYWRSPFQPAWAALGLWTAYNRRIAAFAARHPGDAVLVAVPADLDPAGTARLDAALSRWQLGLAPLVLDDAYVPSLLRTRMPAWLAALARAHAPSRRLWRRLRALHRHGAGEPAGARSPAGAAVRGPAPALAAAGRGARRAVVCVVRPDRQAYSQTFVDAHIRRLPATVKVLHGGYFPQFTQDDRPLLSVRERVVALVREKAAGTSRRPVERRALARWLRREGVEVVLAEFGQTGAEIWEACEDAGVPLVVHFHGGDALRSKWRRRYEAAYRRMVASAAGLVVVSRQSEEALAALGAPRDRLVYNPCGADTALFAPADPAAAPPHFLAVNRFVDKKAPHLTILAFRRVVTACPDARLLMAGNGPLLEACRQLVPALGLEGAVEFLGAVPHAEVAAAMGRVRGLVLHSVTTSDGDVEGTPVSVLEAGAAGLPVVATRHAGIADVVVDGETGLLVAERDVAGMADAVLALIRDPGRAAALGRRGRARVAAEFSLDTSIGRLWEALEVARRRGRPPAAARAAGALAPAGPPP